MKKRVSAEAFCFGLFAAVLVVFFGSVIAIQWAASSNERTSYRPRVVRVISCSGSEAYDSCVVLARDSSRTFTATVRGGRTSSGDALLCDDRNDCVFLSDGGYP